MNLNWIAPWLPFSSKPTDARPTREVNAAFDGLSRSLQQSLAGGLSSNEDLQMAVSNVAWQHMPSLAARLPPEQRTSFAQYRTEVRNFLHDLRAPVSPQAPHLRQQQLATALALQKQWDVWQDLAETTHSVSSWLQVWWDLCKSWFLTASSVCGLVWYFFLRAVGDLEVDANLILPASADVLFVPAATSLEEDATLPQLRKQYLRDFRDCFFGKSRLEDQSSPLLLGLRQSLKTTFPNKDDALEQRFDADMTTTQRVYDRLGRLSAERAMGFVVHVSNHSPRGARRIGELRTRLTYLEPLQFPWRELDVAANLRCEAHGQGVYLELISDAPAINVRATIKGSTGERFTALNGRYLWDSPIDLALASNRRLWVVRFEDDDTLIDRDFDIEVQRAASEIAASEIADSRLAALRQNKPYYAGIVKKNRGDTNSESDVVFSLPRNREDLEKHGTVSNAVEIELSWDDLLGRHATRTELVRAPTGFLFFQPSSQPTNDPAGENDPIGPGPLLPSFPKPSHTSRSKSTSGSDLITAAVDTLDRSPPVSSNNFLLDRMWFSGQGLRPGTTLEHVTCLDADLAPKGTLLIAGRVDQCPPGKYQLEIWLDNDPLPIAPDSSSSKTAKVFISLPLEKFDPRNLDEILSRFRAPDGVDVESPTNLRNERSP